MKNDAHGTVYLYPLQTLYDLKVTEDITDAWKKAEVPASDVDLDQFLDREGLNGNGSAGQPKQFKAPQRRGGEQKSGKRRRYHGTMNTHLLGSILKDSD